MRTISVMSLWAILCLSIVPGANAEVSSPRIAPANPAQPLWDFSQAFAPKPQVRSGYISSYDRTGANNDGGGKYSALYRQADGENVIVDLEGPGCLYTLWFTGPDEGRKLPWSPLRIYLDNEASPRCEISGDELFSGDNDAFPRPLVANSFVSTGGNVSHVPIPFEKRLIITTQDIAQYYNAFYQLYPTGTSLKSWTPKQDLTLAIKAWNTIGVEPPTTPKTKWYRGNIHIPASTEGKPGQTVLLNHESSATVTMLRLNPVRHRSPSVDLLNNVWLRIWWDDDTTPAVDVPIGPFFGSGQGEANVRALPIGMSTSGPFYCAIPMPFDKAARIVLENRQPAATGKIYYEISVADKSAATESRFHAAYHWETPPVDGRDYTIVDITQAHGTYLGQTLIVEPHSSYDISWWEGDLRIWLDQRRHVTLHGTGHEDEFLGGWSSRWLENAHSLPLHGLPSIRLFDDPKPKRNGAATMYRFFAGGIPFRDGIRVSIEHGTKNEVPADYSSVAYYYSTNGPGMTLTDSLDVGDGASEQVHHYIAKGGSVTVSVTEHFDGHEAMPEQPPLSDEGRSGQSFESFTLSINPDNKGVLLRRLYLQSHGRHRAKLIVDGREAGFFSAPDDNRVPRWREQDVILPPSITAGKGEITIDVEQQSGTWNTYRYAIWSITDPSLRTVD